MPNRICASGGGWWRRKVKLFRYRNRFRFGGSPESMGLIMGRRHPGGLAYPLGRCSLRLDPQRKEWGEVQFTLQVRYRVSAEVNDNYPAFELSHH